MQSVFLRRPHKHKHTHTPHVHLRNQWRCGQVKKPIARACPRSPCTEEQTTKSEWMWPTKTHSSQNQFVCTFGCCWRCCCLPPPPTTKSIIFFFLLFPLLFKSYFVLCCCAHRNRIEITIWQRQWCAVLPCGGTKWEEIQMPNWRSSFDYTHPWLGYLWIHITVDIVFFLCCFDRVWHFVFFCWFFVCCWCLHRSRLFLVGLPANSNWYSFYFADFLPSSACF